jgi:hypothetical protein
MNAQEIGSYDVSTLRNGNLSMLWNGPMVVCSRCANETIEQIMPITSFSSRTIIYVNKLII